MANNYYQIPGGEEQSFHSEKSMLERYGHEVVTYTRDNDEIQIGGLHNKLRLFTNTIWSKDSHQAVTTLIREHKPQLAHFQNTFPLISPSVYYACRSAGVPVVQSLRSYRLICINGFFFRDGRICEDCLGKFVGWPGVVHACYRNSNLQSVAVASMNAFHRTIRTWDSQVDLYIALTEFSRSKFIEAGLSPEKIIVKPNYIPDPGVGRPDGEYGVYLGRLSPEKGLDTLLEGWKLLPFVPLKIVGEGLQMESTRQYIQEHKLNATLVGWLPNRQAMDMIKNAAFLVFPSIWYETFGRTIVEAFAAGKPVIASRLGTAVELIDEGVTGFLFEPGNAKDLAQKAAHLWQSAETRKAMGRNARACYEEKFTIEKNYQALIDIYVQAMGSRL